MLGKPGENPLKDTVKMRAPQTVFPPPKSQADRLAEDATQIALEAFGLLKEHRCVIVATCRGTVANTVVKAISDDDLKKKVRELVLTTPATFNVEGDAVAYVDRLNADGTTDEWEYDLSDNPKTWTAVQLVKMLANASPNEDMSKWIRLAREACGMTGQRKL